MNLNDLRILTRVVDSGSFTRAAELLAMPVSSVSTRIKRLESAVGVQLLERSTRNLRLTESGRRLYEQASRSLLDIERVADQLAGGHAAPRGRVRLSTASTLADGVLNNLLPGFLERHPLVSLEVHVTSRRVDLIEEDFDLALRVGPLPDSRLVARTLGTLRARLYAAPSLRADRVAPVSPQDLLRWPLLDFDVPRERSVWNLTNTDGRTEKIHFAPRVCSNDEKLLATLAIAGLGVAQLPEMTAWSHVVAGRLTAVLQDWWVREVSVSAVFPSQGGLSMAARAFVDYLAEEWTRRLAA